MFRDTGSAIREELRRDERLLWSGQPPQGVRLRAADAFLIPFSLMWGGFAIFWETGVVLSGAPLFFVAWGVPFVLIGLYLIVGRFWADAMQRARTYYALTDSRVIIVSGVFSRSARSLNARTLSDITLTKKKNGSGTISFGPVNPMYAWWGSAALPGMSWYATPCFELLGNAEEVYEKILAAQKAGDAIG
jgi:Bacterial PH domain